MKKMILLSLLSTLCIAQKVAPGRIEPMGDWLVQPISATAKVEQSADRRNITLTNGLVSRTFLLQPDLACIEYRNLSNGQQLLRAVKPEARVKVNGHTYAVGGLTGQKELAYLLPSMLQDMQPSDSAFHYKGHHVEDATPFLAWKTDMWAGNRRNPSGKTLTIEFRSSLPAVAGVTINVHYTLFDGMPLMMKWVTVINNTKSAVTVDQVVNEILAVVEEESAVEGNTNQMQTPSGIYVENNFAFNNAMRYHLSDQATHWKADPAYTSQVNYRFQTPCLLEVHPTLEMGARIAPGDTLRSIRTYELLQDSYDRERRGLAVRKMYRTIAPWTTANPIFMHLVSKNMDEVYTAVDQCAETGYEALILSFGSNCNMEDTTFANLSKWKQVADYAHTKKVKIGSYSLFSSRSIGPETDVIDPKTGNPGGAFFLNAPCLGSKWGLGYLESLKKFMTYTGFSIFENDGPYPGDVCASTSHPGHHGLEDSQWTQMELQKGLYQWCAANGIYVNAPDWYFLDGSNKIALGYREVNFSLSREQQKILNRQNIHDALWNQIPSMVWGFVPLTKYQGGGPEAILEPLSEHLDSYEQLMMQYYGAGVQACYRGPRLFDTETTKRKVIEVVGWYKKYRNILNSDIIHLRRADGRDWDGMMHVNATLPEKALVMLYNPTDKAISKNFELPVYYTGKHTQIKVRAKEGAAKSYAVTRDYKVSVPATIPANGYTWLVME